MAETPVCRSQLSRMLRIIVELRARRFPDANGLAKAVEVSRRTIYRDLSTLLDAGVPVRYRPDRRGYELDPGFFLPPVALEESEALALAAHAFGPSPPGEPDQAADARRGMLKIVAALPDAARARVSALIDAIDPASRRSGQAGRWEVDSGASPIRMGLAVNERAHSSVG